jgi:hypothetical protein
MTRTALAMAAILCVAASSIAQAERQVEYLKEEPPTGSVPYRKIVYVDDGTCPKGEVKEITGGSQAKSVPRKVRCVKRPDSSK